MSGEGRYLRWFDDGGGGDDDADDGEGLSAMRAAVVSAAGGGTSSGNPVGDGGDVGEDVRDDVTVIAVVAVTFAPGGFVTLDAAVALA